MESSNSLVTSALKSPFPLTQPLTRSSPVSYTHLERNGVINGILAWLHLPKQNLINTPAAIVLGMVYNLSLIHIYHSCAKCKDIGVVVHSGKLCSIWLAAYAGADAFYLVCC